MQETLTIPLTSLDESFLNLSEKVPMSVQLEVRVDGRLDSDRLDSAMRRAAELHPLTRARLAESGLTSMQLYWDIGEAPDHLDLEVTSEPPEEVRARMQSENPGLSNSPGFTAALVHDDGGDFLMLNLHHAVFDGISAVRLVTSIARAYAGENDELGGPEDIEEARDLKSIAGSHNITDVIRRIAMIGRDALNRRAPIVRVAEEGAQTTGWRYAFTTMRLDADAAALAVASKPRGTTVNDLVLAAHALTLRRWNADHGVSYTGRISIMMPVNLRPAEWSSEVLSNFASYLAIMVPPAAPDDLTEATRMVSEVTGPLKEKGAAGWIVDLLGNEELPVVARRHFQALQPLVEDRFVESTILSNLGRVELPAFGDGGTVKEVWFSPPCIGGPIMPVAVGVTGLGDELHLVLRTETQVIGPEGGARYAEMLRNTLTHGSADGH